MSNQATALSLVIRGREADNTRKQMINSIARTCGVSNAYASTLYNNARKTADATATTSRKPKSKITSITRPGLKEIRKDLTADLEKFFAERGLSVDLGSFSFDEDHFTTKMTVNAGSKSDAKQKAFVKNAFMYGLKADDYGKTFMSNGEEFRISGIKSRAKKYPITADRVRDGQSYKFPASLVKSKLGK
jgi:hypothetical protein